MDLRALGVLQKAVPILLRHIDAYVELVERDWRTAKQNAVRSMQLLAVMIGSGFFALLLCCGVVVALTWDGPYRVAAMAAMAGLFVLGTVITAVLYAKRDRNVFSSVKREWREDRELVEDLLFGDDKQAGAPDAESVHATNNAAFSSRDHESTRRANGAANGANTDRPNA
jgi:uncharacterized membrane protein YqjE